MTLNLLDLDPADEQTQERLYLFTKAGLAKDALTAYRDRQDATNRILLAAILVHSDAVLGSIRREVRRVSEVLIEKEEIARALKEQVIKRETLEGEKAATAARRFNRRAERAIPNPREPAVETLPAEDARPEEPLPDKTPPTA